MTMSIWCDSIQQADSRQLCYQWSSGGVSTKRWSKRPWEKCDTPWVSLSNHCCSQCIISV